MKKNIKNKYLAGGPPQNFYFGQPQNSRMANYNATAMAQNVGAQVAELNASQTEKQKTDLMSAGQGLMSAIGKKKGGFKYKFQTGGTCPEGYARDSRTGQCMPDPNWVGATPGVGVSAQKFTPGLTALANGEYQNSSGLTSLENYGNLDLNPYIKKALDVGTKVAPGTGTLSTKFLGDTSAIAKAGSAETMTGNIAEQAATAGEVTDKVEQGAAMASQGKNLLSSAPIAGGTAKLLGTMATSMASDNNVATVTKGEKFATGFNSIAQGASAGSKYGLPGMFIGGILGVAKIGQAQREAEMAANNIRSQEEQLGVASREASKNSWQGQQSGFGYKSSTNMGMQSTPAYGLSKTGGVRRVPGGKIVPIKGTNAVEFLGNKHSESTIDGVSGIRIDKNTEVEHTETQQPVEMAKLGGSDSSKGKMRDYFFSAYLKLGGKSFARRHKEILASGEKKSKVKALVQRLAQNQEAVANQNGEKDRSPDTIASPNSVSNKYGGIHMYQTAGEEKKDENLNLLGYDIGKGEETGNTYIPTEGSDKEAIKNWEDQQDPDKTYVRFTPSRPSSKYMKKKEKRQKLVSKMYEDAKDFGAFDGNEDSKLLENFNKNQGLALRRGDDSVFSSGRGRKISDKYKKKLEEEEADENTDSATQLMASGAGSMLGMAASAAAPALAGPFGWPLAAGMILGPAVAGGVQAISEKRKAKMPTKYLNNSKVSDKEYENFKLYDTQAANPQSNAVANGVKPETTVNADGSVTVRGAQTADAVKESDGKFRVRDANGKVIAESSKKNIAESQAQNIIIAEQAKQAAVESSIDEPVEMSDGSYMPRDQYEKQFINIGKDFKASEVTGKDVPADEVRYEGGKTYLVPGRYRAIKGSGEYSSLPQVYKSSYKTDDKNNKSPYSKDDEALRGPEASANAQSNADASNVTVRDQNQANASAPSAQTSVASTSQGGTNNAGQNAANTAAAVTSTTNNTSATSTSAAGTPVTATTTTGTTGTPPKERFFSRDDITKGGKGVSKSMEKVPEDQGDQGIYFGSVSNAQFDAFKSNNPWFDFAAGFDPKKRDFTADNGVKGSSDVAKFQEEYNKYVGEGNILRVDGKLGEQTATAMLMFTDPAAPGVTEEKTKEESKEKPKKEPCAEGTFRNEAGECVPMVQNINPRSYWNPIPGITQYAAPIWAALNPYQTAAGISGATAKTGPLPRVNLNQERASEREENVAATNLVRSQSGTQAAVSQMFNNKQNSSMLKIAKQETDANKGLAAAEQDLATRVSMFNAQNETERQRFNKEKEIDEKRYKREDILAYMQQFGKVTAGNYKDKMMYDATERLANALDETGSYTRFALEEALRKDPVFKNMSQKELKEFANAYYNGRERAGEKTNVGGSEKNANTQKLGGVRRYTSRLGELTKRRSLNFSK